MEDNNQSMKAALNQYYITIDNTDVKENNLSFAKDFEVHSNQIQFQLENLGDVYEQQLDRFANFIKQNADTLQSNPELLNNLIAYYKEDSAITQKASGDIMISIIKEDMNYLHEFNQKITRLHHLLMEKKQNSTKKLFWILATLSFGTAIFSTINLLVAAFIKNN